MRDEVGSFAVFANHLNFTTAARALNVSQPALHAVVRKLERDLGRKLYVRTGRALVLTGDGETLARFARDSSARQQRFLAEFNGGRRNAPIVIALTLFGFKQIAADAVRRFVATRERRVTLLSARPPDALDMVRTGRAHVALGSQDLRLADVRVSEVCRFPQVAVLPDGHRLARRRELGLADLRGETLVMAPAGDPHRAALARALERAGVEWSLGPEADRAEMLEHLARMGLGIAIVPGVPERGRALPMRDLDPVGFRAIHLASVRDDDDVAHMIDLLIETGLGVGT